MVQAYRAGRLTRPRAAAAEDGTGRAACARELKQVRYAGNVRIADPGIPGTAVTVKDPVTPR